MKYLYNTSVPSCTCANLVAYIKLSDYVYNIMCI